jgi:hypothetical protein
MGRCCQLIIRLEGLIVICSRALGLPAKPAARGCVTAMAVGSSGGHVPSSSCRSRSRTVSRMASRGLRRVPDPRRGRTSFIWTFLLVAKYGVPRLRPGQRCLIEAYDPFPRRPAFGVLEAQNLGARAAAAVHGRARDRPSRGLRGFAGGDQRRSVPTERAASAAGNSSSASLRRWHVRGTDDWTCRELRSSRGAGGYVIAAQRPTDARHDGGPETISVLVRERDRGS